MLPTNTLRFCTDLFGYVEDVEPETEEDDKKQTVTAFCKQAMLVSKVALDCSDKSEVTKFIFGGSVPTGTKRRILWQIDGKVYKLKADGSLEEYTKNLTAANVLKDGNTVNGLSALTSVPIFVGKKIYPIIALQSKNQDEAPTMKVQLVTKVSSDILSKTIESLVYELTDDVTNLPRISEVSADTTITGNASVDIKIKLRDATEQWSDYMALTNAADKEAAAFQLKFIYKVTKTDGTDSATVNSVTVTHTFGQAAVSGDDADIYSVIANYELPLQTCYVNVRHEPLRDATITAFVNFMKAPKTREIVAIGTGTGSRQELALGVDGLKDNNIDASTIQLFVDGAPLTNFSYNSEVSTVTVKVKKGALISATYQYDHDTENWRQMTLDKVEPFNDADGTYTSRFIYSLPDADATDKTVANVRLRLKKKTGTISNYTGLGTSDGKKHLYVFLHKPRPSTIKFADSRVDWSYDEDSGILTYIAPKGTPLTYSQKWTGVAPVVHSFSAGWALS